MISDQDLLRQYAIRGDKAAFTEVVNRHANLVYSVALRVTRHGALAEDVTQDVFTQMARQAARLSRYDTLIGWLHTTTRYIAIDTIRGEERRRVREQEASLMQNYVTVPVVNWESISPLLDEAVGQLGEEDRKAVLLRYFQNLSHREIGAMLGLSENSANKRVARALEKLRENFEKRGVKASATLLATAIAENSVQAAPVELVVRVSSSALAGTGVVGTGFLMTFFLMNAKSKIILAAAVLVLAVVMFAIYEPNASKASLGGSVATRLAANPALESHSKPQVALPTALAQPAPNVSMAAPIPPDSAAANADPFVAEPKSNLNDAVMTAMHFLDVKDTLGYLQTTCRPNPNETMQEIADRYSQDPRTVKMCNDMDVALHAIIDQGLTPSFNADGGARATYKLDPPVGSFGGVLNLHLVDGMWYLDQFPDR